MQTLSDFYTATYPHDELGQEINPGADFFGLIEAIVLGTDVYEYIGVHDSVVRERLFEELADKLEQPYKIIYDIWLKNAK